jgi:hypothetical protein
MNSILYSAFILCVIFNFAVSTGLRKSKIRQQPVRPNVGDIVRNYQHPMYEKEFEPTEVVSLAEVLPKPKNIYEMANAEIIGDVNRSTDLDQKPTLYSTVVTSHNTSVVHPIKPLGNPNIALNSNAAYLFGDHKNEIERLTPGKFSTPVQISDLDSAEDKKFGKLEKPVFIHKGQKDIHEVEEKDKPESKAIEPIRAAASLDKHEIADKLAKLKTGEKNKRKMIIRNSRKHLIDEAKKVKKSIAGLTNGLLDSKDTSLALNAILGKYEARLARDKVSKLKLVDRVEAKNQLKNKLIAEIEGLRTRATSFPELLKVDKTVIAHIVADIKKQLN